MAECGYMRYIRNAALFADFYALKVVKRMCAEELETRNL
jgi:hypothetical protein